MSVTREITSFAPISSCGTEFGTCSQRNFFCTPAKLWRIQSRTSPPSRSLRKSRHVVYEVRCTARYLVGIYVCHDSLLLGSQLIYVLGSSRRQVIARSLSLKYDQLQIFHIKFPPLPSFLGRTCDF